MTGSHKHFAQFRQTARIRAFAQIVLHLLQIFEFLLGFFLLF